MLQNLFVFHGRAPTPPSSSLLSSVPGSGHRCRARRYRSAIADPVPQWTAARSGQGIYESFYLRAFSPEEPLGIWIRHTVHKRPDHPPRASVWFTLFERGERPLAHKETVEESALAVPDGGWIRVLDSSLGPERAAGECGPASWDLEISPAAAPLRHLSPAALYSAPLPRTKSESPMPLARFSGEVEAAGREIRLDGWPGMTGHNWGSEHAERWVWLHGAGFEGEEEAWLDLAMGRVRVAGMLLPWVANGALGIGGEVHRLGGTSPLRRRRPAVEAEPGRLELELAGKGARVTVRANAPAEDTVGWTYAGPWGDPSEVLNCSIAELHLVLERPGQATRTLHSPHGGAYELGRAGQNLQDLVPIEPFEDG